MPDQTELLELTTVIVAAFTGNNSVASSDLPKLINTVHDSLINLGTKPVAEKAAPAVPINKSVKTDYIVCLEDGRKLKMLKRHLKTAFGMTPDEYRTKWGLPSDYPMTAPAYAAHRSKLAKTFGLGKKRK